MVFVVYCHAGNGAEAKEDSDAIAGAIEEEIGLDCNMPIIIQGDINREPKELNTFKQMIEQKAWTDLGSVASWWGVWITKAHVRRDRSQRQPELM